MISVWTVTKALLTLLAFEAVFLLALPLTIAVVEVDLGVQRFPPQQLAATILLIVWTMIVIASTWTLVARGDAGMFWFDPPARLVTSGPYAYLRHPFVAAVTGQIVALGLALGSVPVLGYAVLWLGLWYFVVRPREERTVSSRYGEAARDYQRQVRGFRPRLRPYRETRTV